MADNYWQERALEVKRNQLATSKRYERELKERMKLVEKAIDEQIKQFTAMFADAKGVSLEDANRLLSKQEMKQWEQSLEQWKEMAVAPEYEYLYRKKMDAQYSKAQYTRLEALRKQMFELLAHHASLEAEYFGQALANEFDETYYRNVFNVQDQQGVYQGFKQFNELALQAVIAQNWQGSNFSKRLWGNYTDTLPSYLESAMTRGVALGYGVDDMVREAKVVFQRFSNFNLHRLINTEFGHVQETATESAYNETDLEQYRYLATLEAKTCEVCGALDYKVFNVKDIERGTNYPLIHPNCRCTTTPYIPEMDDEKGTRWAVDPETGKSTKVDRMNYANWRKQYDVAQQMENEREFAKSISVVGKHKKLGKNDKLYISAKLHSDTLKRTKAFAFNDPAIRRYIAEKGLKVGFQEDVPNSYGVTDWGEKYPVTETMYNPIRFNDKRKHRQSVVSDIKSGWFMPVSEQQAMNYIPMHEMGHVLHNALYENTGGAKTKAARNVWLEGVMQDVYNEAIQTTKKTAKQLRIEYRSDYGRKNYREEFAELYAADQLGLDNEMTRAFNKVLRRYR